MDLRSVWFGITGTLSAQVPEDNKWDVQNSGEEIKSEKDLINQFMENILDRLEGVEAMVDDQKITIATGKSYPTRAKNSIQLRKDTRQSNANV